MDGPRSHRYLLGKAVPEQECPNKGPKHRASGDSACLASEPTSRTSAQRQLGRLASRRPANRSIALRAACPDPSPYPRCVFPDQDDRGAAGHGRRKARIDHRNTDQAVAQNGLALTVQRGHQPAIGNRLRCQSPICIPVRQRLVSDPDPAEENKKNCSAEPPAHLPGAGGCSFLTRASQRPIDSPITP